MKGKWALVTGATAGLELAMAEGLAGAGANIVLHDLVAPKQAADDLRARADRQRRLLLQSSVPARRAAYLQSRS
jgi:NAD(P)-dependent dehydrogenase (short-subunit alcohol dehydrogenase family)